MQVILDPERLAARGVSIPEVIKAVSAANQNTSAGNFDEGKRTYIVRTVGKFETEADVEQVVIKHVQGDPIYVRDVGRARLSFKKREYTVRNKGREAMVMNAVRASGANVLTVIEGIKVAVAEVNERLLKDRHLEIQMTHDESTYIRSAIDLVKNNLYIGSTLAVIVLLLFLRSFSSTLIIAATIPISVIGTFFLMTLFGRNINVISLAGHGLCRGHGRGRGHRGSGKHLPSPGRRTEPAGRRVPGRPGSLGGHSGQRHDHHRRVRPHHLYSG